MTRAFGRVLHTEPLITISKRARWLNQPLGFAPLIENLDDYGRSLHFVGLCFSIEPYDHGAGGDGLFDKPEWLARDYERVARLRRDAAFVILTNTEAETFALSRLGVPCFPVNELIFVDERRYRILDPTGGPKYKAVYNALLTPFKRHELASRTEDLLLIFKRPLRPELERVRALLPNATYANLDAGGHWRPLTPPEIEQAYADCAAALCLSSVEGSMRASMEYLLCGLPVISTPSLGGRDRYFQDGHSFVVEANPGAIAEAVMHIQQLNLPREPIRRAALEKLSFDRTNFLRSINAMVQSELALASPFVSIEPFLSFAIGSSSLTSRWFSRGPVQEQRSNKTDNTNA